ARALYMARRQGYAVPTDALRDTTAWLARPADWDSNHGNPLASDKKLARIQFAAALAEAATDSGALERAADSLLPYQEKDGRRLGTASARASRGVRYCARVAGAAHRGDGATRAGILNSRAVAVRRLARDYASGRRTKLCPAHLHIRLDDDGATGHPRGTVA